MAAVETIRCYQHDQLFIHLKSIKIKDVINWALQWCHNERESVSNHRILDCLLSRLFRRRSEKSIEAPSLAFVRGIHRWPVDSPNKGPVTRKCFHLMTSSWVIDFYTSIFQRDTKIMFARILLFRPWLWVGMVSSTTIDVCSKVNILEELCDDVMTRKGVPH